MSIVKQLSSKLLGRGQVFARRTTGGIQPSTFKEHSLRSRIMATPIPKQLKIPVATENHAAVKMLTKPGDEVLKFQKLAIIDVVADACTTVVVHAPTSGVITSVESGHVADHKNSQQLCIGLTTDGRDEALPLEPHKDFSQLSSADIISLIREAGIVGMGGAGFPAADKLSSCDASKIDLLIINAAECEPYITADESLIRERATQVVQGAQILKHASKAQRCVIAIEDSKLDAIASLEEALNSNPSYEQLTDVILVPSKYPAGSERHLIQTVTGREFAAGQNPTENGIIMFNAGTAFAVQEAVVEGKPCISRITTLCGQALKTPKNFETLIGTPTDFLFNLCGLDSSIDTKTIVGGSLMGRELEENEAAVCKTTNCLIKASTHEVATPEPEQACIRCGFCADACPSNLLPQQLLAFNKTGDSLQLLEHGLMDCIECGACDYVCPSHIPLVSQYKKSKEKLQARTQSLETSQYWQQRFQFRQYRVKKDKDQAQSRKVDRPAPTTNSEPKTQTEGAQIVSKEQASRDIAAAVARVKARREEKKQ